MDQKSRTICYMACRLIENDRKKKVKTSNYIMANSYTLQLCQDIVNSENTVLSSTLTIILKDKYPKAQYHYIATPKFDFIKNVCELTDHHLDLLRDMHDLSLQLIESLGMQRNQFLIGFNRSSSMDVLIMHIISKDFHSDHLRWSRDWTKFNTKIFMSYAMACTLLNLNGRINRITVDELVTSRTDVLHCNRCGFCTESMHYLKSHITEHWEEQMKAENKERKMPLGESCTNVKQQVGPLIDNVSSQMKMLNLGAEAALSVKNVQEASGSPRKTHISRQAQRSRSLKKRLSKTKNYVKNKRCLYTIFEVPEFLEENLQSNVNEESVPDGAHEAAAFDHGKEQSSTGVLQVSDDDDDSEGAAALCRMFEEM